MSGGVGAVVLAAGAATRFGSPKQLATLDGRPLLQHAIDAILAVDRVEDVLIVLGAQAEAVAGAVDAGRARFVTCADWERGMGVSLRCGLAELGDRDAVVVTLGDEPGVTAQVIERALELVGDVAAVRATYDGVPGHPVVLARELLARADELSGDVGARDLLAGVAVRSFEAGSLAWPGDVDTPDDLEALRR